jgi:Nuclease-related domain/AAA domain/UvrD-like helicase C-terminal domain
MATMYPQRLPSSVKSNAERKLFDLLRDHLPNDYTVIWSIDWTMPRSASSGGGAQESEIDFLVLHPDKGILVLEVKGGGVGYDGSLHEWYTIDDGRRRHRIKDPFEQAQSGKHALIRELTRQVPSQWLRIACKNSVFGHAAAFPDIDASRVANRPTKPDEAILDRGDMQSSVIQRAIDRVYQFWRRDSSQPLGRSAIAEIIKMYAPSWYIRPPLINQLEEEEAQLKELTEQQFIVLRLLREQKRIAISGCAGSGKTFLAVEQARRLARRGLSVLLTCYNRNLADWLREQVMEEAHNDTALSNIDVLNFHRIASRLCSQAGISLPTSESHDFDTTFAEGLLQASEKVEQRYDAIIADEGQDFDDSWWVALLALMRSEEDSYFYVFYDDNQRIYGRRSSYPVPTDHHYSLTINCRTTQKIHHKVIEYYSAGEQPTCQGPIGREIEQINVAPTAQAERRALQALLQQLTQVEHIPLDDIVLLSPVGKERSYFPDGFRLGVFHLNWQLGGPPQRNALTCCSIYAFKGLERAVVILAELDKIHHTTESELLIYVAFSRAKQHLILLGNVPTTEG